MTQYMDYAPTPTSYCYLLVNGYCKIQFEYFFCYQHVQYIVVYILCQQANPYASIYVHYA